jgi:hypothetical protein
MQFKKLTKDQRESKSWKDRRNHLVCKILAENPRMLRKEGLKAANRIMSQSKATRSLDRGGYIKRDGELSSIGFESYREYLDSDEWKSIRHEVLSESGSCCMCNETASQVHHFSYEREVLIGLVRELLFPVCDDCHQLIEFSGGKKRTLRESQTHLIAWFAVHNRSIAERIQAAMDKLKTIRHKPKQKKSIQSV